MRGGGSEPLDHSVRHGAAADGGPPEGNVAGAHAVDRDGVTHGLLDAGGEGVEAEAVAQHERTGEDLRARVRALRQGN